jgi:hypothetical protein
VHRFPTRRSQQVAQQTAYNTEVSILAGIAKHVGFPAAPDVAGARPSEIEDDFQIMGVGFTLLWLLICLANLDPLDQATAAACKCASALQQQFLTRSFRLLSNLSP